MASLIGINTRAGGIKQIPSRVGLYTNGVGLGPGEQHPDTITIVRDTRAFPDGEAPPDWRDYDGSDWPAFGAYWYAIHDAYWQLNPADFYQITNEQGGGEGPDVAGNYEQLVKVERAIMQAANADGRKCAVLNLAGGSPGDFEIWKAICAPFIFEAWETGGNIYSRHCYADWFVEDDGRINNGQPARVIAELEYLRSIGYGGGVVLTECGLYGGYGLADYDYFEQQVTRWEQALRPYADMFIGLAWWETGASEFQADYTAHLKKLLPYIEAGDLPRWTPPEDPEEPPMDCNPREPYSRKYLVAPQDATLNEWLAICEVAFASRNSVTFSYDDAGHAPGVTSNTAVLYGVPEELQQSFIDWYALHYPETAVEFAFDTPPAPPLVNLIYRPCQTTTITQSFGANPDAYDDFGLPGHDGTDYAVGKDLPFYATAAGTVVHASDRKWSSDTASGYGWHVVLDHGDYCTVYAHARPDLPVTVGQSVEAGQVVGYSGNTGNSTGYHLHFGLFDKSGTIDPGNGYPVWVHGRPVNPVPFVDGKPAPDTPAPPPPPPAPTIDLLQWFRGDHRRQFDKEYKLANGVTGTQTTQVFHLNNGNDWLYIKGENGHYEHLGIREWNGQEWIWRFEDTSEANDRWYSHFMGDGGAIGAPWLPRFAEVGKWYETPKFVQHYGKDSSGKPVCTKLNSGNVVDKLRIVSEPYGRAYESGQVLRVITAEWNSGEQYDFAGGNVAFRNAAGDNFWFMQWMEGRADKTYKKVECLNVGW